MFSLYFSISSTFSAAAHTSGLSRVCERSPDLGLRPAEEEDPAGGPGGAARDVVYLDFDRDLAMVAGCEKARAALL